MADAFLAHVIANPGQRMEHIARELGVATPEFMLPVRKLLADGKLRVQGQKRATQYYPAEDDGTDAGQTSARRSKRSGIKVRRGKGRPKKKA
jgi:hypothetical protein